jgi:hypothetical protein
MHPAKVKRGRVKRFTDLPNVGPAFAGDLKLLGFTTPDQLRGQDPLDLYQRLARKTGVRQDPCVLDTFMSLTDFMNGAPPRTWWSYTKERKQRYGKALGY